MMEGGAININCLVCEIHGSYSQTKRQINK